MKKRMCVVLVLSVLVLTMTGAAPALAGAPRTAAGGVQFTMPLTGMPPEVDPMSRSWAMFNIVEHVPGGPVNGWYTWHAYNPFPGWVKMNTRVVCANFDLEDEVVFVAQVTMFIPTEHGEYWPPEVPYPVPGRYVKIRARDGGSPGAGNDAWGFYLGEGPGPSFGSNPGCGPDGFYVSFPVTGGNLSIHD